MSMKVDDRNPQQRLQAILQRNLANQQARLAQQRMRKQGQGNAVEEEEDEGRSGAASENKGERGLQPGIEETRTDVEQRQVRPDQDVSNPDQLNTVLKPVELKFGGKLEVEEDPDSFGQIQSLRQFRSAALAEVPAALRNANTAQGRLLKFVAKQSGAAAEETAMDRVGKLEGQMLHLGEVQTPARDRIAQVGTITPLGITTMEPARVEEIRKFRDEITLPGNDAAERMTAEGLRRTLKVQAVSSGKLARLDTFANYRAEGDMHTITAPTSRQKMLEILRDGSINETVGLANMLTSSKNRDPGNAQPLSEGGITRIRSMDSYRAPAAEGLAISRQSSQQFIGDFVDGSTSPSGIMLGGVDPERTRQTARANYARIMEKMSEAA